MSDVTKTKEDLINELAVLREKVTSLEALSAQQAQEIEAFREVEERYQVLFNNSDMGIVYFDLNYNYIMMNDSIAASLGGEPKDFIGKSIYEIVPKDADVFVERCAKAIANKRGYLYEDSFKLPDGTVWYSSYLEPIIDTTGEVVGVQAIARNITERKQIEEQLRYQSSLVEKVNDAIISTDMDFTVQSWNRGAENMYGWTAQEAIGQPMGELVRPEYLDSDRDEIIATFMTEGKYSEELIHHHKDGTRIHLWGSVTLIYDDKGVPTGAVAVNRDITQRMKAENALRESQQNMTAAQRIAHLGSWDLNVVTNDIYWSDEMYRIYGVEKGNISENDIVRELIHPDDLHLFSTAIDRTLAGDVPDFVEYRIVRPDGETRLLRATAQIFCDESGQVIRMMGTTQDITKQKEAELLVLENERLITQFHKEQEQNELVQRIISTLSHDMRTPLSLITLSRDMLAKYYERLEPDRRIEMLDTITNQTEFAVKLLEDTVQVARGQPVFNPQPVNVATLCRVSIDEVYMAKQDYHRLVFENADNVETVSVDATLVSRILLNLLSNAIKYSPNGGEIKLELSTYQDGIVLCVTDEGMGIAEDDLSHIFDLLYRSDTVNDIQGTGLGLNIVKDCVERHHGEITVESKVGKGSVFTVRLPV